MRDLSRLLRPRSVVVFGAGWAENVVRQCEAFGFEGDIWPVHPTRDKIAGRACFRSVDNLPGVPDAAFIGVNRHATLDVLGDLQRIGCGGAVAFAAGFSEAGAGDLQAEFVARAGDMPVLGPNCYGVINCLDGAVIWPDQQGCKRVERGVAILSQSSNIAITCSMQRRGLPVAYIACVGNAAQTSLSELADAVLADDRVTALGVYMEGVGDAAAFANVVNRARVAGKGVVVLKAGHSADGAAAAQSHTASLAGGGVASSAYLARIGAGEVRSLSAFCETLKVLHAHGPLEARSFVSVSCSGGEAALVADAAAATSLTFPAFSDAHAKRLGDVLGPIVTVSNPLDYNTVIWGDVPKMTEVFTTALDAVDAGLFVIDPPRADTCDPSSFQPALDSMAEAAQVTGKPAFVLATLPESVDEPLAAALWASGLVPLLGVDDALAALEAARLPMPDGWRPWEVVDDDGVVMLDEAEGKAVLRAAGLDVPASVVAAEIGRLDAGELEPPFALKGLGFAHKSEAGAVRLGLHDLAGEAPMDGASGYLLEEMVEGAVADVLIGVRRDPVYGATLTVGIGGVKAELLEDTVTLVLPVTEAEVRGAFEQLRLWPLLDGYRGRPRADVDAAVAAVMKVQALMASDAAVVEVEINPLMLRESGAVAADALIRRRV